MITNETKDQLEKDLDKLFNNLEQTIILGVTEEMSPNDIEYETTLDQRWLSAMTYIEKRLETYGA